MAEEAIDGGGAMSSSPLLLYHEVQESRLCAVHCVNAVLQGPYFSEVDLATMAQELDAQEQQVMLESGAASSHYLRYMAEGSSNVDADGNFSIQVLNRALHIWNLQCVPLESSAPEAGHARADPQKQSAFICHLQAHWFCIRRVGERWYNFNSLYPAPEYLSNFYLSAYLDTLKNSGWSIFVVQGSLPSSGCWGNEDNVGRWLTSEEAERITRAAKEAQMDKSKAAAASKMKPGIGSANLAAALAASIGPQTTASLSFSNSLGGDEDEDADYASAIAASLADIQCPPTSSSQPPSSSSSQGPDASALAQALASSLFSAARASGVTLPTPPPPKD